MATSAISASVRYLSDGDSCAWPVPFPFGNASDLGVSVSENGGERSLVFGKDFLIQNNCVMAVVPAGAVVSIWLKTDQDTAIANARAKAVAPAVVMSAVQQDVSSNDAAIEETVSAGLARLQQQANELAAMLTQLLQTQADKLRLELEAAIAVAQNSAHSSIINVAVDKSSELSRQSASSLNDLYAIERDAISALDEKGRAFSDDMAAQVNAVKISVMEADDAASKVSLALQSVNEGASKASAASAKTASDAEKARTFAANAWQAAWQASTMANRPGIVAIGKLSELDKCGSGMFIINGRIVHTPTMFFGLWPVDCPCCAAWDGFFIIGPKFPDDPVLPPYLDGSDDSANTENPGSSASIGGLWGPCIHHNILTGEENNEPALPVRCGK